MKSFYRCRNNLIVGGPPVSAKPGVVSSRGSSGIGSDLAPSPERPDGHTSSGELIIFFKFNFIFKSHLINTKKSR